MSITETIRAEWDNLSARAQTHIRRTRPALLQQWELIEGGYAYDTIMAETGAKALDEAESNVDRGNYPDVDGTFWIDVRARNTVTGEMLSSRVTEVSA